MHYWTMVRGACVNKYRQNRATTKNMWCKRRNPCPRVGWCLVEEWVHDHRWLRVNPNPNPNPNPNLPGGKMINHLECSRTSSHSLILAANRSVTSVVRPVPGILQAIHLRELILYLFELVMRLPTLSFRIVSIRKSLPSVSVAGSVWYRSENPSG